MDWRNLVPPNLESIDETILKLGPRQRAFVGVQLAKGDSITKVAAALKIDPKSISYAHLIIESGDDDLLRAVYEGVKNLHTEAKRVRHKATKSSKPISELGALKKEATAAEPVIEEDNSIHAKAKEEMLRYFETCEDWRDMSNDKIGESFGLSELSVRMVKAVFNERQKMIREGLALANGLSANAKERFDTALRVHKRHLENQKAMEVEAEVRFRINNVVLRGYEDRLKRADQILAARGKPPFSNQEYRQLMAALHPDGDPDRRTEMFALVRGKADVLRGKDEQTKPLAGALPTLAELMERRRKMEFARKKKGGKNSVAV